MFHPRYLLFLVGTSLLAASSAYAQTTYTWNNTNVTSTTTSTSLNWFNATQASWTGGTPVSSNLNTIQFFDNTTTSLSNTVAATQASILDNGGTAFQLGTLTLSGRASNTNLANLIMDLSGNALNFSAATGTMNLDAINNGSRTITYNIANNIQLGKANPSGNASTLTLTGNGTSAFNFTGNFTELQTGTGSKLIKSGSSTATLSGAVTVSGGLEINGGMLSLTGSSNAITGGITLNNGGTLDYTSASTINGNNISVNGAATLRTGANPSTNANIILNSGANLSLATSGGSQTFSSAVTGDGSLTITRYGSGSGTYVLSSTANNFTGGITFANQGNTLQLTVNSLADSASVGAGNIAFAGTNTGPSYLFILGSGANAPLTLNNRRIEFTSTSTTGGVLANNSSQAFTINTDLLVGSTSTPTLALRGTGTGLSSFNGLIGNGSGTVALTKSESGTWVLGNSANTYTGQTSIQAGTLSISKLADFNNNSSIGAASSGAIILGNGNNTGTLLYTGGGDETNRTIQINTTTNTNTGGATIINNGTGALTFDAPTFNAAYTNASTVTRILTLGGSNGGTISGTIQNNSATNTVGLTKTGAGTWEISGASSNFTGATTVNSGKLKLTGAIGATSSLVMGGGTFEVNPNAASQTMASLAVTSATAGSNIIIGAGKTLAITSGTFSLANWTAVNFDISASGSVMTLPVASKDTYLGTTSALATVLDSTGFGFAAVNSSNQIYRLTSPLLVASGGSNSTFYRVDNNNTDPGSGAGTGIGGNNLTITATQTVGSLVVDTTARSGVLTLASGAILRSNEFAFGSTAASSGNTYTITGSAGGAGIAQAAANNNINVSNYGGTVNFETPFLSTGSGYINFSGTGTTVLKGTNVYTGQTKIFGSGTLQIGAAGSLNSGNYASNIEINGSSTLQYSSSTNQTLGGIISGTGALIKDTSASSVLTLTGNNTYTGATSVSNGTLIVNGSISNSSLTTVASGATIGGSGTIGALTVSSGGFINPGNSPGALDTGNFIQAGLYTAEITGLTPDTQHDQINVTGSVNIAGGSLTALFSGLATYSANDLIFILLNDGTDAITGTYTGLAQGATVTSYGGFDWQISYTANNTGIGTGTFTGGNDIALIAVIPEPSVVLLSSLGVLLLFRRRR